MEGLKLPQPLFWLRSPQGELLGTLVWLPHMA